MNQPNASPLPLTPQRLEFPEYWPKPNSGGSGLRFLVQRTHSARGKEVLWRSASVHELYVWQITRHNQGSLETALAADNRNILATSLQKKAGRISISATVLLQV